MRSPDAESFSSGVCRQNIETLLAAAAQTQGFEEHDEAITTNERTAGVDNSGSSSLPVIRDDDESQLVGAPVEISGDIKVQQTYEVVLCLPVGAQTMWNMTRSREKRSVVAEKRSSGEKRKRGRPKSGQVAPKPPPPKREKQEEEEEEDVCFICLNGGDLVLCDHKGCPKAYHPPCIKRDEEFFRTTAKWNCGWHICNVCQKSSHFMCYTCTYSLCKGCTKDADYLCVRGNKGFCGTCMNVIMQIENKDQVKDQVDFDDESSWEYLFKMYWIFLKKKLSLTLSEVTQAKQPWKDVASTSCKRQLTDVHHNAHDRKASVSYRSSEQLELNKPPELHSLVNKDQLGTEVSSIDKDKKKSSNEKDADAISHDKSTEPPTIEKGTDQPCIKKALDTPSTYGDSRKASVGELRIDKGTEWASKDLLEFVAYMKNGDTSTLSQLQVQSLLLDYIKRNNLWDPHQESQIICDLRLKNLFGKSYVALVEMLNLLEFHFLINEHSQNNAFIPAGVVGSVASDMDFDANNCNSLVTGDNRKQKARKKIEERSPQKNSEEYTAIDAHNINLIYLRRNMMENLIKDKENFHDSVVGSIVRIRISSSNQKEDIYKLVQVVGTSKVVEPHKIGCRAEDVLLEVLNSENKEAISIDAISDQEFSEDECRQLRQSIRCGLAKPLTVGEVRKKAMALQAVLLDDLEADITLRPDQASEEDHKKELRECVEKLQSSEELQHSLCEVPEIHTDLKMNPGYESEEDTRVGKKFKEDEQVRPECTGFSQNERKPVPPNTKGKEEGLVQVQNRMDEEIDASGSHSSEKHASEVNISSPTIGGSDQASLRAGLETSTETVSMGNLPSATNIETENLWHYRDPNGKIQGPFSMLLLRMWNMTGLFPSDMRIWTNHEEYDSLLLSNALNGLFHEESQLVRCDTGGGENMNGSGRDDKQTEALLHCNNASDFSNSNTEVVREAESGSSSWPHLGDMLKDNRSSTDTVPASRLLSSCFHHRGQESDGVNHGTHVDKSSSGRTEDQMTSGNDWQNKSSNQSLGGQCSEGNVRSLLNSSSDSMDSKFDFLLVAKSPNLSKQDGGMELSGLSSPTPKTSNKDWVVQTAEKHQYVSSDVHMQSSAILELLSAAPKPNDGDQGGQATEIKLSMLTSAPLSNSSHSWSSASSLVVNGKELSKVADEWCECYPTHAKPSVEDWDAGLVSTSSLEPPRPLSDPDAAPDSHSNHLTLSSSSHPASSTTNWDFNFNEPIMIDDLGEDLMSHLLSEAEMESQGGLASPTAATKFAEELSQDCKDDCFSVIEGFNPIPDPGKSETLSSSGEVQLTCQSGVPWKLVGASQPDALDPFRSSGVHSSASSVGETNGPVFPREVGSELHPPAPNINHDMVATTLALGTGSETADPGWGPLQGNINLVTVQGNVNLFCGGPAQGIGNLGWGTNSGTAWGNPNMNRSSPSGSLPRDNQRKTSGERFTGPRDRAYQGGDQGFGRGRAPWGRHPHGGGGGGYSRPLPKGQRVCKFYESGRCKKGAFCDYLHP